jgi:diphthamide biosynthesis enzyme Dph1/Dph2-like protein
MRFLFIPAKSKAKINKNKIEEILKKLPQNIGIAYSIQFEQIAKEVKTILSKTHKITSFIQVLGCSKPKFPKHTSAILLIGSGKFHAISLSFETGLPIYILHKEGIEKVSNKDIDLLKKRHKASYLKFLNANKVGILVSLKPGQQRLAQALQFKKKLRSKKSYVFLTNDINASEVENYQIDSWINTACPRLDLDMNVMNMGNLK